MHHPTDCQQLLRALDEQRTEDVGADYEPTELEAEMIQAIEDMTQRPVGLRPPGTNRFHIGAWSAYTRTIPQWKGQISVPMDFTVGSTPHETLQKMLREVLCKRSEVLGRKRWPRYRTSARVLLDVYVAKARSEMACQALGGRT